MPDCSGRRGLEQGRPDRSPHEPTGRANARPMTGSATCGWSRRSRVSLRSPGLRTEYDFAISRRNAPELCFVCPLKWEGAGKTGCTLHPRSRVQFAHGKRAHEHTGTGGASRPSLRNGFTAYFVLSPANGSFATVAPEKLSLLPDLMPAPRHQDHTTSPYASGAHVCRAISVHRIPPRVRDVRERPLIG
jgi:hypothetical protein